MTTFVILAIVLSIAVLLAVLWPLWRSAKPLVIGGLVLAAITTTIIGFTDSVWVFGVAAFLSGVGSGTLNPGQQAAVADVIGPQRSGGTVLSRFQMSQDAGQILGPLLAGMLVDVAGFGPAFLVSGALMAVAALAWTPVVDTLRRPDVEAVPTGSTPRVRRKSDSDDS